MKIELVEQDGMCYIRRTGFFSMWWHDDGKGWQFQPDSMTHERANDVFDILKQAHMDEEIEEIAESAPEVVHRTLLL